MTQQTDPETTRGDQFQGDREELHVASGDMVDTVKSLIHEGNAMSASSPLC
jgi:hypothetical protein